jgi:hypothetical protein
MEGLDSVTDLPHTISFAITYRTKINSFFELPKDKQPPRNLWDKPYKLSEYLEKLFASKGKEKNRSETYIEYDAEDVE